MGLGEEQIPSSLIRQCLYTRQNSPEEEAGRIRARCSVPPGDMLLSGPRHHVHGENLSPYRYRMTLRIGDVTKDDFSAYHCVAKNALGEMQDLVRLQGRHA